MAKSTTVNKFRYNLQACQCMLRVIFALALREVHTLYGGTKLGYLWVIVRMLVSIGIMLLFRILVHYHVSHNMSVFTYMACGFGIWFIVTDIIIKNMSAIEGNKNLLTFPQVFPLDIMLARCLVVTTTNVVTLLIILAIGYLFHSHVAFDKLHLFFLSFFFATVFSLGCGAILSALAAFIPALFNLVPLFFRLLMFVSGVFMPVEFVKHYTGQWIMYNPFYQFIEMLRSSLTIGYISPNFDIPYLTALCLCVLTIGLLLERYIRKRIQK